MLHAMQVPAKSYVNLKGVCDSICVAYFNQIEMGFVYIKSVSDLAMRQFVDIICDETTYQRLDCMMQSVRDEGAITALEKVEEDK